ncbi:MAG: response regulator [Armatimonadota bacterium]
MFVLVVDDNLLFRTRLLSQLRAAGWKATAVGLGPEALTRARQHRPDTIVVNLAAVSADATLFVRELKAAPDLAPIPILGFCGHRETGRREAAIAAGCDRVVSNSSVSVELPTLVRAVMSRGTQVARGS